MAEVTAEEEEADAESVVAERVEELWVVAAVDLRRCLRLSLFPLPLARPAPLLLHRIKEVEKRSAGETRLENIAAILCSSLA